MIAYHTNDDGHAELGPDVVYMKNRYEVTNGQHEANEANMIMRAMSYGMQLGNIKDVENLVND